MERTHHSAAPGAAFVASEHRAGAVDRSTQRFWRRPVYVRVFVITVGIAAAPYRCAQNLPRADYSLRSAIAWNVSSTV